MRLLSSSYAAAHAAGKRSACEVAPRPLHRPRHCRLSSALPVRGMAQRALQRRLGQRGETNNANARDPWLDSLHSNSAGGICTMPPKCCAGKAPGFLPQKHGCPELWKCIVFLATVCQEHGEKSSRSLHCRRLRSATSSWLRDRAVTEHSAPTSRLSVSLRVALSLASDSHSSQVSHWGPGPVVNEFPNIIQFNVARPLPMRVSNRFSI